MEDPASQTNDVSSLKEEGELSDDEDDELNVQTPLPVNNKGERASTTSKPPPYKNHNHHSSLPPLLYSKNRYVSSNKRKRPDDPRIGVYSSPPGRRDLMGHYSNNKRRNLIGNNINSNNNTNGPRCGPDGIPLKNCSDLPNLGGISGGYWAPPHESLPPGPPRIPPLTSWEKVHHHHPTNQPQSSRGLGPVSVGGPPAGPGNIGGPPPGRPLSFGPWSDSRRIPLTPRSQFRYWEKKRYLRRQSGSLIVCNSGNQAPGLKDDGDYEDLLEKYRNIQEQLATLAEEEDRACGKSDFNATDENSNSGMSHQQQYNSKNDSYRTVSILRRSQSPGESSSSVKRSDAGDTTDTASAPENSKNNKKTKEDDEDLELEELRRLALASTDKPKSSTSSVKHDKSVSRTSSVSRTGSVRHSRSFSNSLSSRLARSARNREPSVLRERMSSSSATRKKVHLARRHQSDRSRRSKVAVDRKKQDLAEEQRRDIYKILDVKDPAEQLEKLAKFVRDRKKDFPNLRISHSKSPSSSSKKSDPKGDTKAAKLLQDNYEEVAMDLDSDDGTSTVPEIEDVKIDIQRGEQVLFPNVFPDPNLTDLKLDWPDHLLKLPPPPPPPPPPDDNLAKTAAGSAVPRLCHPALPPPPLPPFPLIDIMTPCMPPPPPPPLPEEPYPESEKPPEPPYDEDEEEEKLLRAQLLQSIQNRRKENSNSNTPLSILTSSLKEDSPSSSRSQSPFNLEKIEQERKKPYYPPKVMPKHPSVVINLAEDSSDSDVDTETESDTPQSVPMLSGLDQFLKDARKSVESKVEKNSQPDAKQLTAAENELAAAQRLKDLKKQEVDLQAADAGFRQMEEKYVVQRKQMLRDQVELKSLVTQASKFLTHLKTSEKRCEVLKENLKKSEELVKVNQRQVIKVKAGVQRVKSRLQLNQSSVLQLEKNLLQIGKRLYGNSYQPRTIAVDSAGNKRELPLLSTKLQKPNVLTANHVSATNNTSSTQKKKNVEDIAKEKKRLELMQLEYAAKLHQLQAQKKAVVATPKSQPLPRLEKITIDCTDEPESSGQSQNAKPVVPMRRKSLITLNSNMKPEIVQDKENIQLDLAVPQLQSETLDCFKMPDTSQLTNLRKVLHQKMQGLLKTPNSKVDSSEDFDLLLPNVKSVSGLKLDVPPVCNDKNNLPEMSCFHPYKSPLLHFRSYRFSPFFRTKENLSLTCSSFSHKLNPKKVMCNYDLLGTCNDQECTRQHTKDYSMSKTEILQEVVSYAPGLAGVTEDLPPEKLAPQISSYVENVLNQNHGRMTTDELCLLQVSKVNEYATHVAPHTMFFEPRSWKPSQQKHPDLLDDLYSEPYSENHTIFGKTDLSLEPDSGWEEVVNEQDIRYFAINDNAAAIDDLESALLQDAHNDQLWLKLANKKLNSWKSERLDEALNVLARGLESNKKSLPLWQRYLHLYSQHQDSQNDLINMCKTAIQNAPTYSIWWLYLSKVQNYFEKTKLCKEILQFLKMEETNEKTSHYITEIILYQVGLMVITNRYKTGLLFLKNLLQTPSSEDKEFMLKLMPADRCLLWLCYIHLYEFHQLPDQLYDPGGSHPDKLIVQTIQIDWRSENHQLVCQMNFLVDLFHEALDSCIDAEKMKEEEYQKVASILYCNLFSLFRSQAKCEEAVKMCLDVLNKWPELEDVWLSMAQLYIVSGDRAAAKRVFTDALGTDLYSAKVYLYAAMSEMAGDDYDRALEYLEEAVVVCFNITTRDPRCDPNILYCCLLGQAVPLDYKTPEYCDKVNSEVIQKNQIYLWLGYSLLLELQGDHPQAIETYETALSTVDLTGDIAKIWQFYLRFQIRQLTQESPSSTCNLPGLVIRCLTSLPAKTEVPHWPGHHWINYEHHNNIVDLYISCLSKEQQFIAYDKFISIMPNNTNLILRAFDAAVAVGDFWRASAFCQTGIHEKLPSIPFWIKVTSLAIEKGGGNEVQQLFMKAVRVLPYAVSLWKHFLFFEVTLGAEANVLQIIRRCKELDVNILGFVKTISR